MITIQEMSGYAKKLGLVYEMMLSPLGREIGIHHTALSMLLFFANNPNLATGRDICELRGLKRAIVSTHVERMVSEGFLERKAYPGDRRKELLICTEKAMPIIEEGRKAQVKFAEAILKGLSEEDISGMEHCFKVINENLDSIIKSNGIKGDNIK